MLTTFIPIRRRLIRELLTAIATSIEGCERVQRMLGLSGTAIRRRNRRSREEGTVVASSERGARPGVFAKVKRILVTFCLILIFKSIITICT